MWPALLLQELPQGAQARLDEGGEAAEGNARPAQDLGPLRGDSCACLRYEDQSYRELKKNLPHKKTRVGTPEGPGLVIDGRILVQLVLVKLEGDGRMIAVPVEELMDPDECPPPGSIPAPDPFRGDSPERVKRRVDGDGTRRREGREDRGARAGQEAAPSGDGDGSGDRPKRKRRRRRSKGEQQDAFREQAQSVDRGESQGGTPGGGGETAEATETGAAGGKKRRRRRRGKGKKPGASGAAATAGGGGASGGGGQPGQRSGAGR